MDATTGSEAGTDIGFFRNTGFALVALTVLAGSISLIGSLTATPIEAASAGYAVGAVASVTPTPAE